MRNVIPSARYAAKETDVVGVARMPSPKISCRRRDSMVRLNGVKAKMSPSTGCSFSNGVIRLLKRRKRTAVMMLSNALTSWLGASRPMIWPRIV